MINNPSVDGLSEILDEFRLNIVAWDPDRGIKRTQAKSAIKQHYLSKLPEKLDVSKISSAHDLYSGRPAPFAEGYRKGFNTAQEMILTDMRKRISND